MGKGTNAAVTARVKAQRRVAALHADRAERDERIARAAAEVFQAQEQQVANGERRALTVEAARAAIARAERDEQAANTAAADRIAGAVARLRAEGLAVARIAELLDVPVQQVRRWAKHQPLESNPTGPVDHTGAA